MNEQCQVAVYAEFRRDWVEALRFYEEAYRVLREVYSSAFGCNSKFRYVQFSAVVLLIFYCLILE